MQKGRRNPINQGSRLPFCSKTEVYFSDNLSSSIFGVL